MDNIPKSDWIRASDRFLVPKRSPLEPKVDELVSKALGFKVYINDPRLIKTIVRWKKAAAKPDNSLEPDNYLEDPAKLEELRKILQ